MNLYLLFHAVSESSLAIHREAPPFVDQSTEMEMLVTGIKVKCYCSDDCCRETNRNLGGRSSCSVSERRKNWTFWWCWSGQNRFHHGADQ